MSPVPFPRIGGSLLLLVILAPSATAQQPDIHELAKAHRKQVLVVDPATWQTGPVVSPEARARIEAVLKEQRARKAARRAAATPQVSGLLRAYQAAARAVAPSGTPGARHLRRRLPVLGFEPDGAVRARIRLRSLQALDRLTRAGVRVARIDPATRTVHAALLPDQIDALAADPAVERIVPVIGAQVKAGSVTTEGDAALRSDRVRRELGVTGKDVRIGVISDGIESIAVAAASGDIPVDKHGAPAVELCPLNDNAGDEGTAMLEIIHDVAPRARLAFCPAFGSFGEQGLADAVTWLATKAFGGKGAQIIVDDVGYLTEPFFQDGVIAQAVDAAAKRGVVYFSSAGNMADAHYEKRYVDVVPGDDLLFPLDTHDFGTAAGLAPDPFWLGRVAGAGNFFAVFLQWNDPFGASANDYDVYIFDLNGWPAGDPRGEFPIGANGTEPQDGTGDPLEVALIINPDGDPPLGTIKSFLMVVDRYDGSPDVRLEMNFNGTFAVNPIYNVEAGSVWGHAAARGAIAVAATGAVENIDGTPNPSLDVIEEFSSRGPSLIYFTPEGKPRFEARKKPDFTATDGVSVTGVNFVTPFFGTSASAPHAAAIAALLIDVDGGLGPRGVARVLRETARERGEPGFDTTWGFGLVDAYAAAWRAGQVGRSPLYWLCLPGKRPVQVVAPRFLVPLAVHFGLEFGRCRPTS